MAEQVSSLVKKLLNKTKEAIAAVSLLKILFPKEKLIKLLFDLKVFNSFDEKSPSGPIKIELFSFKLIFNFERLISDCISAKNTFVLLLI